MAKYKGKHSMRIKKRENRFRESSLKPVEPWKKCNLNTKRNIGKKRKRKKKQKKSFEGKYGKILKRWRNIT